MVVRLGVLGTGNIGAYHIELLQSGKVDGAVLAATSSRQGVTLSEVPHFEDYQQMFSEGDIDAVLIATPTMSHLEMGLAAIDAGLHVLMEKPVAMSVFQAEKLLSKVPENLRFAIMLNQRFDPAYSKLKTLLEKKVIGEIQRLSWTMTAWYRPDIYYQVSRWRGTWQGEGGGLLINQCIHNLDILQWLVGLPQSIVANVGFGKYHDIDVEDEVNAMMTFPNGSTAMMTASSGEAPGVNRLEIVGDRGSFLVEDSAIKLFESAVSVKEHVRTTSEMFGMPSFSEKIVEVNEKVNQHAMVLQNFVDAVQSKAALATPGPEGLGSLQLANGILLSAWRNAPVQIPLVSDEYESVLQNRISKTALRTPVERIVEIDMENSYR